MNEPKLWDKLLGEAPPGSVLMGGAVIDYMFGLKVNDYDIFYSYKPGQHIMVPDTWVPTEADFNDPVFVKQHKDAYLQGVDDHGNHPISIVYEYLVDGEHKVQLIGVNYKDPLEHFKNFDHSLTLGRYSKRGLSVHRKVFQSYDTKTITYVSKNFEKTAVMKSLLRANKKAHRFGPIFHNACDFIGFTPKVNPIIKKNWFE